MVGMERRHLSWQSRYPEEKWGFQVQQALEKMLKAAVMLSNQAPESTHMLAQLVWQLGEPLCRDPLCRSGLKTLAG